MPKVHKKCSINLSKGFNDEFEKEDDGIINETLNAERGGKDQTNTEFIGGLFAAAKEKWKETTAGKLRWMMGAGAGIRDALRDMSDPHKLKSSLIAINRRLKNIIAPIAGSEDKLKTWSDYRTLRYVVKRAKTFAEQFAGIATPSEAREEIAQFDAYMEKFPESNLKEFIEKYETQLEKHKNIMATDPQLAEVIARHNAFAKEKIDKLYKINPDIISELLGDYSNASEALDTLESKIRDANSSASKNFYKEIFGIDTEIVMDDPRKMDIVTHHILHVYEKNLILHNLLTKTNRNQEFKDFLEDEIKGVEAINYDYISRQKKNHPLRISFDRLIAKIVRHKSGVDIYKEFQKLESKDVTGIDKVISTLELLNTAILKEKNNILFDDSFKNVVKNNYEKVKNLHAIINGSTNYDASRIGAEIEIINQISGQKFGVAQGVISEIVSNQLAIKNLKKLMKAEAIGNAKNFMERIKEKFPDCAFVTSNGTRVFNVNSKISDIENNKEIFGNIVDLTNAEIVAKDLITAKEIQDNKEEAIMDAILDGRLSIVSSKEADLISYVKKDIRKRTDPNFMTSVNRIFSKFTLFSPLTYPGYALTTQVWGNIGHTMMSDPSAFKHWWKFMKEVKKGWNGDFESIEDPDIRSIITSLLTTENGSLHGVSYEDWNMEGFEEMMEEIASKEEVSAKDKMKIINSWIEKNTKIASIIEMVSRGSMAYRILEKRMAGREDFAPATTNPKRVEHLWDFDPHLAAVRLANDSHIDYSNLPPAVRRLSAVSPFLSFKVGSTVNAYRGFVNTFKAISDAMFRGGSKQVAMTYASRGALGLAWRAGVAATIWNYVLSEIGLYSDEKRKQNNKFLNSSIFNRAFKALGINLDNHIYLPGTGWKGLDSVLRIGKANQKYDVYQTAEQMVPFVGQNWTDSIKKEGSVFGGLAKAAAGMYASGLNPIIKAPIEELLGGGSIYENGYHPNDDRLSETESVVMKAASFFGAGTLARTMIYQREGIDSEYKDDAAFAVKDYKSQIDALSRTEQDDEKYKARKHLQSAMDHFNTGMTLEFMRKYEHILEQQVDPHTGKKLSRPEIEHKVREVVLHSTLAFKVRNNPGWFRDLAKSEQDKVEQSIQRERGFLDSIGFGTW